MALKFVMGPYCFGHERIPACWCRLLPTLNATWFGHGWEPNRGLVGEGQSFHSIGLVRREICILGRRAATPSKGFLFLLYCYTWLTVHYICCKYAIHIFHLCRSKVNQVMELRTMRLFLGPLARLWTSIFSREKTRTTANLFLGCTIH
jgi:hypothetical protein